MATKANKVSEVEAARANLDGLVTERAELPSRAADALRSVDEAAYLAAVERSRSIDDRIRFARARLNRAEAAEAEERLGAAEAEWCEALAAAAVAREQHGEHTPQRQEAEHRLWIAKAERDDAGRKVKALQHALGDLVTEATKQAAAPVVRSLPHIPGRR